MVIILHACETGQTTIDEKNVVKPSFAQKLSASEEFKDTYIVAPNTGDYFSEKDEVGVFYDGENTKPGKWLVFLNGKKVAELKNDFVPKLKTILE